MVVYSFEYSLFPPYKPKPRPVVVLPFWYLDKNKTIELNALIDSGADTSVSFKNIGEQLDIIFGGPTDDVVSGVVGSCPAWKKPINFKLGNTEFITEVLWMDKKHDADSDFPIILGRDAVFQEFDITFCRNDKVLFNDGL